MEDLTSPEVNAIWEALEILNTLEGFAWVEPADFWMRQNEEGEWLVTIEDFSATTSAPSRFEALRNMVNLVAQMKTEGLAEGWLKLAS